MDEIIGTVKDYILTTHLPGEDPDALTPATQLLTSGILDSLATVELVSFLERQYSIELEAHDTDPSRLGTLADIARQVQSKLATRA